MGHNMTESGYIVAVDQGTTGTTAALVDSAGRLVWKVTEEITQIYPRPGWVEHDPEEIFGSCLETIEELLEETEVSPRQIAALGIANQRETAVIWERDSGKPVTNAIVWQCRRTAPLCEAMKARGMEGPVKKKTGLPVDAYFSGTKLRWILDNVPDGQRRAERGELLFGTVDSWLLWNFSNGTTHATDATNASRTMLFGIDALAWDDELLRDLDIPPVMLPRVRPSNGVLGYAGGNMFGGQGVPIAGVAGDQHAALFGQRCFQPGDAKNTYGTGSFVLMNTGGRPVSSQEGLISTVAWGLGDDTTYALEGSIFSTGATVQWLRDGLGLIGAASEVDGLAKTEPDSGGVFLVPAFTGLGAPHWDMDARGTIAGLTRGTTAGHIARAALEASAYRTRDVVDAMVRDTGLALPVLRVDGGGTASDVMMQFQADILGVPVECASVSETTALGAAYLAGLGVGFWESPAHLPFDETGHRRYEPRMSEDQRETLYNQWTRAVERSKGWATD